MLSTRRFLQRLVAKLPHLESRVVWLHYFEEKAYRQIASELKGLSKAKVCRIHQRAVEQLRELIRLEYDGQEGQRA